MQAQLMTRWIAVATTTAALVVTLSPAQADIQYTQEMRMPGSAGDKPFSTTTTYRRPGAERTETVYNLGGAEQRSAMITICAKKEIYTLDPALKLYYATPMVKSTGTGQTPKPKSDGKKTGTMIMTLVSLRDLGPQTVGSFKTRGYEVVARMQTGGCMGNSDTTSKQQIYVAPAQSLGDGGGCSGWTASMNSSADNECQISMVRKGDWTRYEKLTKGLQVRHLVFRDATKNAAVSSESLITNVSRAKLPATLFTVPADYRRVSAKEFQTAQQRAMMEKMTDQKGLSKVHCATSHRSNLTTQKGYNCDHAISENIWIDAHTRRNQLSRWHYIARSRRTQEKARR